VKIATIKKDFFADARSKITIADAWEMLELDGEPKPCCKSPFREDRSPSFSIHSEGKSFKDHATGDGGDVIEFIRLAIGGDHRDVRKWIAERIESIHVTDSKLKAVTSKVIQYPAELITGDFETWKAFARSRNLTFPAVHSMVKGGLLRFCVIDGVKCYVVTDAANRAAEIRRIDKNLFGNRSKAYPLKGVDKSWMPGMDHLRLAPKSTAVLVTEGASDLLSAIDLYSQYRRNSGSCSWLFAALLGAGCRELSPEALKLIRGRHVRLVPDGDKAGDQMADHWTQYLRKNGCSVDVVNLPRDTDLTDHLQTISTQDLFSL
jgi:hypothetical protein